MNTHTSQTDVSVDERCAEMAEEARIQAWMLTHAQIEETDCALLADRIIALRTESRPFHALDASDLAYLRQHYALLCRTDDNPNTVAIDAELAARGLSAKKLVAYVARGKGGAP